METGELCQWSTCERCFDQNAGNLKNSFRIGEKFFPIRKLLCIMIGKLKKLQKDKKILDFL